MHFRSIAFIGLCLTATGPSIAMQPSVSSPARAAASDPYEPYAFLIGDWYSTPPGGGPAIHQSFRWGTNRASIAYTTLLAEPGRPERVHFEGLLVWNGANNQLDYVVALEPGSGGQEKGVVRIAEDGAVVREVVATLRDGSISSFRQTFRRTGPDGAITSLMRRAADGWEPNFPGSGRIEMVRKAPG